MMSPIQKDARKIEDLKRQLRVTLWVFHLLAPLSLAALPLTGVAAFGLYYLREQQLDQDLHSVLLPLSAAFLGAIFSFLPRIASARLADPLEAELKDYLSRTGEARTTDVILWSNQDKEVRDLRAGLAEIERTATPFRTHGPL